jgi:hypothetical protein
MMKKYFDCQLTGTIRYSIKKLGGGGIDMLYCLKVANSLLFKHQLIMDSNSVDRYAGRADNKGRGKAEWQRLPTAAKHEPSSGVFRNVSSVDSGGSFRSESVFITSFPLVGLLVIP